MTHQTHAALPTTESNTSKSVYAILNRGVKSPYTTSSIEEYADQLRDMTLAQLHDHAMATAQVIPIDDRDILIRRLVEEFGRYKTKEARRDWTKNSNDDLTPAAQESILKIMKRGRF